MPVRFAYTMTVLTVQRSTQVAETGWPVGNPGTWDFCVLLMTLRLMPFILHVHVLRILPTSYLLVLRGHRFHLRLWVDSAAELDIFRWSKTLVNERNLYARAQTFLAHHHVSNFLRLTRWCRAEKMVQWRELSLPAAGAFKGLTLFIFVGLVLSRIGLRNWIHPSYVLSSVHLFDVHKCRLSLVEGWTKLLLAYCFRPGSQVLSWGGPFMMQRPSTLHSRTYVRIWDPPYPSWVNEKWGPF